MTETRIHPETGKMLHRDVRQQTVRVGSLSQVVDVPGWYPEDESDAIHTGADLQASNDAFKALRVAYAGRIRSVRKQLGLTQEEAGVVIGGGKRAFQKYESGRTSPSDAAIGLIEILARHPEEVELLRGLRVMEPGATPKLIERTTGSRERAIATGRKRRARTVSA